jgi:cellulose synthase/poly-beta-1,6-N-acetylglucosamine synthase-like glycosyltransferase
MPTAQDTPPESVIVSPAASRRRTGWQTWPLLLFSIYLIVIATLIFLAFGVVASIALLSGHQMLVQARLAFFIFPGDALVLAAVVLGAFDLFVLLRYKRQDRLVAFDEVQNRSLTVVLTAYNDELCIGQAVDDFRAHPLVRQVIVVDNNSKDRTAEVARAAGAVTVIEKQPGYGRCVFRALSEGLAQSDTELTLLCEGDMTFRAFDIDKFLAYVPHAEIVNGTRIVEQLRERDTQLTTFMYYGNFAVGKLLEAKYLGQGTFTDVGTTYKLCRNTALARLLPHLNPAINLSFNAHFLDMALRERFSIIECPITFHKRVGVSKGGNINNLRAIRVGLSMIKGITLSWKH